MANKRVFILYYDDWTNVYVDGQKVFAAHSLDDLDLLKLAKEHEFTIDDVRIEFAGEEDTERAYEWGDGPEKLEELLDTY